ncbi:MAG TPA: hypothetical protein PK760_15385, partial [Flavobacteriales bacterium]|nr:hypothetical protein [Flavobacteriales bacterium]
GSAVRDAYFSAPATMLGLEDLLALNRVICSSALVRKDLIVQCGGFPEAPALKALDDYALWLRIATMTEFNYRPEPLVLYTDTPQASVRSTWTSGALVREAALSDLHAWAKANTVDGAQRSAIARNLRGAKRAAGRPPWKWLFIS